MNNQNFVTRRGSSASSTNWSQKRRNVSYDQKGLGKAGYFVIVSMLTLVVGLIYVAQGTKTTSFDYQISEVEAQISDLEAKKESLAVERARLTSIASASDSEVAVAMEDGDVSGYAEE